MVVFLRVGHLNSHRAHAALFDGEEYIGTLAASTRVAYQAEPGLHRFMSTSEGLRFMEADLRSGKIYYVAIVPSGGAWKPNWKFEPQNGQTDEDELQEWLEKAQLVAVNDEGQRYARLHEQAIREKLADALPEYLETPPAERAMLRPESGR